MYSCIYLLVIMVDFLYVDFGRKHMEDKKKVTITGDFVFGKVMENPEIYRKVLEIILERPVERVTYSNTQETMKEHIDSHGIRMDAYMQSDTAMYNTEMQLAYKDELKFRSRYNGSMMDINDLNPGETYKSIRKNYVIFICGFDPMKEKEYKYEFATLDLGAKHLPLGEGVSKIYINLKGKQGDITPELKELIDYMVGRKPAAECKQDVIKEIDAIVMEINKDKAWRIESMRIEDEMKMREARGRREGEACGEARGRREGEACGEVRGEARGEARGIYIFIKELCRMGNTIDVASQIAANGFNKTIAEIQEIMAGKVTV